MANPASSHIWNEIKKLGLTQGVASLADYERLALVGWSLAHDYLSDLNPDPFAAGTAQNVHELMFGEVHPWAGEFRKAGQSVIFGGYPGADGWRISQELDLLQSQTTNLHGILTTGGYIAAHVHALICAFHHVRFERIHPFQDGNGRFGRLLSGAALRQTFGVPAEIPWAELRIDYFAALKSGTNATLHQWQTFFCGCSVRKRFHRLNFHFALRLACLRV